MRLVYGRGASFPITKSDEHVRLFGWAKSACHLACDLDVWLGQDQRLFVRIYSNRKCHEPYSYELVGHAFPEGWIPAPRKLLGDEWVPEVLRDLYAEHVEEWIDYPND